MPAEKPTAEPEKKEPEFVNRHFVSLKDDRIIFCRIPPHGLTADEAAEFAAWLVAASGSRVQFDRAYEAIIST